MRSALSLRAELDEALPALGWIAQITIPSLHVAVSHGKLVERGADFAVEGVWSGDFSNGRFHEAKHFFGSGVRRDELGVWLVPSHALVDRLVYCVTPTAVVVANSLPLLLARTGGRLDPRHDYRTESLTSLRGLSKYERHFHVISSSGAEYFQQYYHPLFVDADGVRERERELLAPEFDSFAAYSLGLRTELDLLVGNARHPARARSMDLYSTISAGYDSAASTVLVKGYGLKAAYTSRRSNSSIMPWMSREASIDDGTPLARLLDVPVRYLDLNYGDVGEQELEFLSASTADTEIIFHQLAHDVAQDGTPALVFTGYHGDKVWEARESAVYNTPELKRGDTSGLNLGEIRLSSGFINVPIPFLFARNVEQIRALSQSEEMRPWSIGGAYDRPIPRRLLEEAGVARSMFGLRKRAVVQTYIMPHNDVLRRRFLHYLSVEHGVSPLGARFRRLGRRAREVSARVGEVLAGRLGLRWRADFSRNDFMGIDMVAAIYRWAVSERQRELEAKDD